jgi:exodeoxyribonuclease-5
MACKKITRTNGSESKLIKTLEHIYSNEFKAEEAYAYFDVVPGEQSAFVEEFGDWVEGYKEGDPSFSKRVYDNGEPKLFYSEESKKYYFISKNDEQIPYPIEKRGLRSVFDYKQMDRIVSRLALNYFKQSPNINFNNIEFEEGEKLPRLRDHVESEIKKKIASLQTEGPKGKFMSRSLGKSLDYLDEYVDRIDNFYKQISIKRVDNDEASDLQTISEEGKDPVFNKASFEQDSKNSLSNNIKLRLSLLENNEERDPVWNEPTFVPFNDVYSTLLNNISNQVALPGEDMFELQRTQIKKIAYKKEYLNQLIGFFNDKRFTESDKNQFAQAFNLHKQNFLVSEIRTKVVDTETSNVEKTFKLDVKEVSESGSKASIVESEWGNNFRLSFLKEDNSFKEGAKANLEGIISELDSLLNLVSKDMSEEEFTKYSNEYVALTRELGVELTKNGFINYLDDNGSKSFNIEHQKGKLTKSVQRTSYVLKKSLNYFKKAHKDFNNPFETQSIFKELAKAESFFLSEGSDASIWTSGKNKWLFSYPSYISTRILQWKKNPELLRNWYDQSAYNKGSELAKYLLALDINPKDEFGNKKVLKDGLKEERRKVSKERLDSLNLGVFNTFQEKDGDYVSASDISYNDYFNDNLNKVLSNSYVRTTTPADKTTDLQIRTGLFVDTTTIRNDEVSINDRTLRLFFNYFNSEFNRMKEANAEVDVAGENPENLRIHYHYKAGSDIYSKNGNAFNSQYFPELSFSEKSDNSAVNEIKSKLYNSDGSIKHTADLSTNPELRSEIEAYINDMLQGGIQETVFSLINQEVVEINKDGYSNKRIDKDVFKKYLENNFGDTTNAVTSAASDFYINGLIQNIEYSKLFTGDVAFYKNMVDYKKRIPGTYTDGLQLRLKEGEETFTAATINSIEIESPVFDKLVEMLGEDGAKPYKKINSADAQAWITPQRWRFLLERLGKWDNKTHNAVYEKMTSDTHPIYTKDELKIMAQPLKGVYFYMNGKTPTYLKYSQAVLTRGLVKNTGLEKLFNGMQEQGVDELITIDGFKVGSPTPTTIHNAKGEIDNVTFNKVSLSNYGWKLQQDLPIKTFKQTDVGSQIQKNIFAGLKFNAKQKGFYLDGKDVTGKEISDGISDIVKGLIGKGLEEVNKEFSIGKSGKINNVKGLYNALVKELEKRGGSKNIIDALNKQVTLYGMPQSIDKIISIYSSIMNDRLIKIKTNGGAFIQMSNFGISKENGDKGIIWSPVLNNGDTTFEPTIYVDEDTGKTKIRPGGILISGSFIAKYIPDYKKYKAEELFGYTDEDGNKVEGIIDDRILSNIVGYRIPNQGLSSNDALQIVGILPEENGDTIVAYTGITTKTGSDFDIDKMFIMMSNYTLSEGKLKYTEYNPELSNEEQSKEAVQNRLVELYKAVLTNPKVIKDVMKPVDIKFIENEIKDLVKADTSKPMFHFDAVSDIKLRYEFIGGKAGVGQEANALVDINRIGNLSLNKYYIGWGHSEVRNNIRETVFDKEFSEQLSPSDLEYYLKAMNGSEELANEISKVKIGDSLTAILNAFVDIAKDPYITRGNWTTSTTNIGNLLLRSGTHPLYVTAFMAQPIIKQYVQYQSSLESITSKNSGDTKTKFKRNLVLENLIKLQDEKGFPYGVVYQKMKADGILNDKALDKGVSEIKKVLGKKATFDEINPILDEIRDAHNEIFKEETVNITSKEYDLQFFREQITGKPDGPFQLAVYKKFLELQEVSKTMKENVDVSKLDTNGMGKNINSLYSIFNLKQYILGKEENDNYKALNGLQSKFDNTTLGHYFESLKEMMRIVQSNPSLFPQGQEKVQKMFNTISDDLYSMPATNEELTTDLEKNYYTYVMSNFNPFNLSEEESRDLLNNLPAKFDEFRKEYRGKYMILDELQIKRDGKVKIISLNNRKKSTSFEEKFTDSWRDLRLDHVQFAEDLIKYSFLTSGFRMNSNQFYTYIPHEYMINEGVNYFVPKFSRANQEDFIDKFYLNNTHKYKYVPLVFENEMVTRDKESGFIKKESGKSRFYVQLDDNHIYKLEGYDSENKGIYTRVNPLGKKLKGSVVIEYGDRFIKRPELSNKEEIDYLMNMVVTERENFNPNFELSEVDERIEEPGKPVEVKELAPVYRKVEDIKDSIVLKEPVLEVSSMSEITNHSGGAYGADTYFDIIGREFGVTEHKHYREGKNTGLSQKLKNSKVEATVLTDEQMETARIEVERLLGKKFPNTVQGNLQVRNYYQVANSDAVFAVAPLDINDKFNSTAVHGGTNTAVQLGIKLRKPVYVWDTKTEKWNRWNGKYFELHKPPILTKDFAGVGTRDIENYNTLDKSTNKWTPRQEYLGTKKEEAAKQAIRDLYKRTEEAIMDAADADVVPHELTEEEYEAVKREAGTNIKKIEPISEYPLEIGRFVDYNGVPYIVTQFNAIGTVQIYNPGMEGALAKLSVSKSKLTSRKEKGKFVTYLGSDYVVTPNNTIISLTNNKIMKWVDESSERRNILSLAEHGILATPKVDIITNPPYDSINNKQVFKPANEQQENAINVIQEFVKNGNPGEILVIEGKAGTGKTTIVQEAIAPFVNAGKKILIAALSHKAKLVLSEKLDNRYPGKIESGSIAGILGKTMDVETGEFTDSFSEDAKITKHDIIIIDEASMVNEEAIEMMMEMKRRSAKLVFLGDRGQLPPIRDLKNPYYHGWSKTDLDSISPVFDSENKASLTERVRQGEESPILPFADYYWDNSELETSQQDPVPDGVMKDTLSPKGNLVFVRSFGHIFEDVVDSFKRGILEQNPNVIKVVTYRNATRTAYNNDIRKAVFGEDVPQLIENDIIMFQDNFDVDSRTKVSNSDEFSIKGVRKTTYNGFQAYAVTVERGDGTNTDMSFPVLADESKVEFNERVAEMFAKAKQMPPGALRKQMYAQAWGLKKSFANIDYAYAITSHKSQGSTYDSVIVDIQDINSVGPLSAKSKSRSIYTALTRAKTTVIGISNKAETIEGNASRALNLTGEETTEQDYDKFIEDSWNKHSKAFQQADPTMTKESFMALSDDEKEKLIECYGK